MEYLLGEKSASRLRSGAMSDAATKFSVSRMTIYRVWKRANASMKDGSTAADTQSRKIGNSGRKRQDYSAQLEKIKSVPFNQRGTIQGLAYAIELPQTTTHRLLKEYELL